MANEKYINIDLDDERIGKIADVISNKTCKKILDLLADKEMSAGEIADELKVPLNTVGYNLEKLSDSGLIEKDKAFLWSEKGKRVIKYKVANKKIVISPKSSFKGILPAVLLSGLIAFGIKVWNDSTVVYSNNVQNVADTGRDMLYAGAPKVSESVASASSVAVDYGNIALTCTGIGEPATWFFFGALIALIMVLVWNWRKIW